MKKIGLIVIALVLMVVLAGCKEKNATLTCSTSTKGNNMNAASDVTYTFVNDKLTKSKIEVVFKDITVDNLDLVWDAFKTRFTEQNKPVEVAGFKREVKADDTSHTFSVLIDIDYSKISKDTMKKYEIEDFKDKSYKEIKKIATENDGMTCK